MVIKYKCWDSTKKAWRKADPSNMVSMFVNTEPTAMRIVAPSEYTLVLYTGFSDKNNVDMYRGDILDDEYYVEWDILGGRWLAITRNGEKQCDFTKFRAADHTITGSILESQDWLDLKEKDEGF